MGINNRIESINTLGGAELRCTRHGASFSDTVLRLACLVGDWRERARQRHQLARLDDRMLRDIGLSRADVELECRKRPWQR